MHDVRGTFALFAQRSSKFIQHDGSGMDSGDRGNQGHPCGLRGILVSLCKLQMFKIYNEYSFLESRQLWIAFFGRARELLP